MPTKNIKRADVEKLVEMLRRKRVLEREQMATQAEMLRECVKQLRLPVPAVKWSREETMEARREHSQRQLRALKCLEDLAVMLEKGSQDENPEI